ncbi:MAG: hypothetical protein AB8B99_08180 [Phormidesmis sp.]
MTCKIAQKLISTGFICSTAFLPVLASSSPAEAATRHCRNVNMHVTNSTGGEIRIVDIDYYDPDALGDWRSEPIGSHKVSNGSTWKKTRRLEKVNGQLTQIRVDYQQRDADGDWGYTRHAESASAVCAHGTTYSLTIN